MGMFWLPPPNNWMVVYTDSHGATSESPTWQFTSR